ncbi:kinase-like domain-containing protein [Xylaria cf. heliscus]|nr:kinase-like domain-containing protein [Xylaria cf. heliscus]
MEKDSKVEQPHPAPVDDSTPITDDTQANDDVQEYEYNYITEQLGLEDFSRYNKGGFHPIHIDDVLDDRFEVLHKLGSGGFGTVWLCRDRLLEKWRAVKVMAADHSSESAEAKTFELLKENSSLEELDRNHIAVPLGSFWINGPNGRHLCFVLPVYGCTVSRWRDGLHNVDPGTAKLSKKICQQLAEGLSFLHRQGLCHGDLRPSNILMKLDQDALHQLDQTQMSELVQEAEAYEVKTSSGVDPRPRGPEYCVIPLTSEWCEKLLVEEIVITDFGESFFTTSARQSTGIPTSYAAPEILFRQPVGAEIDIWSLACTFYEIRTGDSLFGGSFYGSRFETIIYEIEVILGSLPNPYRKIWDDEGYKGPDHIMRVTRYDDILEAMLGEERVQYFPFIIDKPPVEYRYEEEEVRQLADLLRQMLQYHPQDRISTEVIKEHQWLQGNKVRYIGE